MRYNTILCLKTILLLTTVLLTACDVEDFPLSSEGAKTGRIVLSVPEIQVFTEGSTRATGNIDDYTYTLNSVAGSEHEVSDSAIIFAGGSAIIPAGKYTLTATSKTAQDAAPWYQGTSAEFTLGKGETKSISIDLGKPKNVEIAVSFASSFTTLYENYSVTIGGKTVSANGNFYAMPGTITYTVKGFAKAGSHVSDIPAEGITGTINVEAGKSYPLNITANTITDILINIGEGEHNGEFDTREFRLLN